MAWNGESALLTSLQEMAKPAAGHVRGVLMGVGQGSDTPRFPRSGRATMEFGVNSAQATFFSRYWCRKPPRMGVASISYPSAIW